MEIQGPGNLPKIAKIVPDKPVDASPRTKQTPRDKREDTVLISEVSKLLNKIASMPSVRQEKIDQIKAEIEKGGYLTDEKLDVTINRILEELGE